MDWHLQRDRHRWLQRSWRRAQGLAAGHTNHLDGHRAVIGRAHRVPFAAFPITQRLPQGAPMPGPYHPND